MEWVRCSNQKALFLKIDFAKPYDHIEWPFILDMLSALGFGLNFIQSMNILFSEALDCITINGCQSQSLVYFIPFIKVVHLPPCFMCWLLKGLTIFLLILFPKGLFG